MKLFKFSHRSPWAAAIAAASVCSLPLSGSIASAEYGWNQRGEQVLDPAYGYDDDEWYGPDQWFNPITDVDPVDDYYGSYYDGLDYDDDADPIRDYVDDDYDNYDAEPVRNYGNDAYDADGSFDGDYYYEDEDWYGDQYYSDDWYDDEPNFDNWYNDYDETFDGDSYQSDLVEEYLE